MSKKPCPECGNMFDELELVPHGSGVLCFFCAEEYEQKAKMAKGVWVTIVSAPVAGLMGTMLFCVAYVNLIAPGVFGLVGIYQSIACIRIGRTPSELESEMGITSLSKTAAIIAAILGILSGLSAIVLNLLALTLVILSQIGG